jgi:glyoxylase-like metal-dependent hydrolase (beta-lactamase superfamily II)
MGELGVTPGDLKMILMSHLHLDHTAGLPELPKSVRLVAGPGAMQGYEIPFIAPADHLAGYAQIETLDFTEVEETALGRAIDLFGDGSLFVISAPGHVQGNLSFLINRKDGALLLTCDASHSREGLMRGVGPGKVVDREAADATVKRFATFLAEHPEVSFKAGHDALDWTEEASGVAAGVAEE